MTIRPITLMLLCLAACTPAPNTPANDSAAASMDSTVPAASSMPASPGVVLQGGEWSVGTLDGKPLAAGTTITMQFNNDGRIVGKACNRFSGTYTVSGNDLTTSPLASTRMACSPDIDRQEMQLLSMFEKPLRFHIENDVLRLERDGTSVVTARRN